jgi:hypothetical protein
MTSFLRAAAVTAAALSLVVITGCGSSDTKSSNDYISAINKVQTDFAANVQKVGSGTSANGSDPAAAAKKTFADLKTAIDKAISDLKGVNPPDKVKSLHGDLISEMQEFETDVKAAGASLSTKDSSKILKAQSAFATSAGTLGTRISQTIDAINKKLHS